MNISFKKSDIFKYLIIAIVAYLSKQIVNQLVDFEDKEAQDISGTIQGHDYVDLGLSVKWATCNIGAEKPWDYGDYFAWGETGTKKSYTKENSTTYGVNYIELKSRDVVDDRGILTLDYDAASANWGKSWRMPSREECAELLDRCEWSWKKINGVSGYKVTGKNGNWIFLPAAGGRNGTSNRNVGSYGRYWSSTVDPNHGDNAYNLYFSSSSKSTGHLSRLSGRTVRPVTE